MRRMEELHRNERNEGYKFKGSWFVKNRAGDDGLSRASEKRGADRPAFGVTRACWKSWRRGEVLGPGSFLLLLFLLFLEREIIMTE